MGFLYLFAEPLAFIIRPIYSIIKDYGLTLIVVTILIKLLTIPLTVMSQKNVSKTQLIQPELEKIQKKYANDKEKLGMEMQKLYKDNDVNPMGGCLPLLVQMFVLFGFIRVVYDPLTYILQLSKEQIQVLMDVAGNKTFSQVALCGMESVVSKITEMGKTPIDFNFFGIDLTKMLKGNETDIMLWIFPVLATIATFLSSYVSKKQTSLNNKSKNSQAEQAQNMSDTMLKIMPIMTAFFTYTMPVGMSLYWFISTVTQIIQQTVITKAINNKIQSQMQGERK